ncbi:hypothetical protein F5B21DRAFT_507151 [Xylaria acuta]|nr:hypothetical protein F5B21DRAFT_507151 [Xylaria acuta]
MAASLPATQSAIVADATGDLIVAHDVPLPKLNLGLMLIRTAAVAVNPGRPTKMPGVFVLVYARQLSLSPRKFALAEAYGAQKAFDHHDPTCAEQIRAYTEDTLDFALDCYCHASSMEFCYKAITMLIRGLRVFRQDSRSTS